MRNKFVVGVALGFFVALWGPLAVADGKNRDSDDKSTAGAKASSQWIPVEQDVWTTFLEAPEYHFAKARESLANKDTRTAAAEIRQGALLLRFQAKRLEASVSDLYQLANQVNAGTVKPGRDMDAVLARATKSLDYREALIPVAQGEDELLVESSRYHVDQAKSKLTSKDHRGAAVEIRKAIAYLKIETALAGRDAKADSQSVIGDMETLAKKIESGADVEIHELDQAFARARKALSEYKR